MNKTSFFSSLGKLFLSSLLLVFSHGCANNKEPVKYSKENETINHLMRSTVGLYSKKSGGFYCSGFYVAEDIVVTARHCVARLEVLNMINSDPTEILKKALYEEPVLLVDYDEHTNPASQTEVVYKVSKILHTSLNTDISDLFGEDIAVLKLESSENKSKHWLSTANNLSQHGEIVYSVGFPVGAPWILSKGIVSQYLTHEGFDVPIRSLIINMTAYFGSSGSPVVNDRGEVVGLVSAIGKAQFLVFCPSNLSINMFLYGFVENNS